MTLYCSNYCDFNESTCNIPQYMYIHSHHVMTNESIKPLRSYGYEERKWRDGRDHGKIDIQLGEQ